MAIIAEQRADASFVAALEAANLHPLWDRYQRITPIRPQPQDAPFIWRWRDVEPFLHRSVGEVAISDVERRALILANPAFGNDTTTTSTMLAAFTVLEPGDRARPHRHTGAAIRFATNADGAASWRPWPPVRTGRARCATSIPRPAAPSWRRSTAA